MQTEKNGKKGSTEEEKMASLDNKGRVITD